MILATMINQGPLVILYACLSMAAKDALGTMMTVAESRGKAHIAALCDAGNDLATVLFTLFGAGEIIVHGITVTSMLTLAAIMATSYVGTRFWVQWSTNHIGRE